MNSSDSITNVEIKKVTVQHCINMLWADKYTLNHWDEYDYSRTECFKRVFHYSLFDNILKIKDVYPEYDWVKEKIKGFKHKFLLMILWLPSLFAAKYYIRTRM